MTKTYIYFNFSIPLHQNDPSMLLHNYSDYLSRLSAEEQHSAPKELFFEGDFRLMTEKIRISIVGSRKVSDAGKKRTELIAKALVKRDIIVVSGLADGVDTIAHQTAINHGGKTIAVLGTPLDKCYPVSNKELLGKIKSEHLAISQFKEGQRVYQSNFPARNKTMALISDATIIIEASEQSGTRHQAWEAIRLGRQVFLMENIVKDENLKWPKELLNYGAIILTRENYESVFDEMEHYSFVQV